MEKNTHHMAVWFELPAVDFERAVAFYTQVLGLDIVEAEVAGLKHGLFPHDDKASVSGAIVCGMGMEPSKVGSLVYLNGGDDLAVALSKVGPAGGEVVLPKTHLGDDIGYIAHFIDSEGNRVGIHSMQ